MTRIPEAIDPAGAAPMLAAWGFLAHSDLPDIAGPSWLLVAIRPHPTLAHYDPESVEYWVAEAGRGTSQVLDRTARLPLDRETTWGMIRVVDRVRATNEWYSFGGRVQAERIDEALIAVFSSPAPLLRRGGHSQGWDEGAADVGAFFARLRAAAGGDARFEAEEATADPLARYACFVAETARRHRQSEILRRLHADLARTVAHEEFRLRRDHAEAWAAGERLLARLDAASTAALLGDASPA